MKIEDYLQKSLLKPVLCGLMSAALNHFVLKDSQQKSAYFGIATTIGVMSVGVVSPVIADYLPSKTGLAGINASLETRVIEVLLGSASVYVIDKFVLKNNTILGSDIIMKKVGIIAISDIAAESIIMMV